MIFLSGKRHTDITYDVVPARRIHDISTGFTEVTKALRAKFKNHEFDSIATQKHLGWSDEERKKVEQYLMKHPDFNAPGGYGIFLKSRSAQIAAEKAQSEGAKTTEAKAVCVHITETNDGDIDQCSDWAMPNSLYCEAHERAIAEAEALT